MIEYNYCPQCAKPLESREIDGEIRKVCPEADCGFIAWGNPTPVVAAIVERGEEVVLVRNREWSAKMFGLVTGFLEAGESPEQGVLREVEEELGLRGVVEALVGLYSVAEMNQIIIAYHVSCQGEIELGEELAEYRLIATEKLKPWPFGTGLAVAEGHAQPVPIPTSRRKIMKQ